jgi:NADPH:quinone reductase-like Zn-dependent oxidoreductase
MRGAGWRHTVASSRNQEVRQGIGAAMQTSLEVRSRITKAGKLELWLEEVPLPEPATDEVVVRIEAAPINPSDLLLLLGPADLTTLRASGPPGRPTVTAEIPEPLRAGAAGRLDQALPVGNEGAGTVIAAGADARALVGRVVALRGPGMYATHRVAKGASCMVLPEGTPARVGAAAFINPLTALGMIETMRREGHTALVHTAAASNVGQMLLRLCHAERIGLVNVVRSTAQERLLRELGAEHVVDSSRPTFFADLVEALARTKATLAFDAIGGGAMAGTILTAMEVVASRGATIYSRYGSSVHKQVYLYGSLDPGPTVLERKFGLAWSVGGWLLTWFLEKVGPDHAKRMQERVASELTTTFASQYKEEVSLAEALAPSTIAAYGKRATGAKYLIVPTRDTLQA